MNLKAFFVDALTAALELGIGTPDDVLRHVTPDVLSVHLPRPLWARLLAACLGAPRTDSRLVVETIGVANLCEHIPASILWACIADVATHSLAKAPEVAAPAPAAPAPVRTTPSGRTILAPPPAAVARGTTPVAVAPVTIGPSIPAPSPAAAVNQPLADLITELEQTDEAQVSQMRPKSNTAPRFRQSNTGAAGRGLGARRPQAAAPPPPVAPRSRRAATEPNVEAEPETAVGSDWGTREIAVDDSQLVDWQANDGTANNAITGDDDFSDLGSRKR